MVLTLLGPIAHLSSAPLCFLPLLALRLQTPIESIMRIMYRNPSSRQVFVLFCFVFYLNCDPCKRYLMPLWFTSSTIGISDLQPHWEAPQLPSFLLCSQAGQSCQAH